MYSGHLPQVAVIADAHFHDLEGDYDFEGAEIGGRKLTARSWADTGASTRVFNESFQAFRAALDAIAARGIRHVVLPGDYSDDGQRSTTGAVRRLLESYQDRLSFYAIPGNHDAYGPHGRHQSKRFLLGTGEVMLVTSNAGVAAASPGPSMVSDKMYCEGYPEGLVPMAGFGLFRSKDYLHWETPFGQSDSALARLYQVSSSSGDATFSLMDASYLVEPEEGLWLLMIDANVFEPRNGQPDPHIEEAFIDSTGAGWNALIRLKPFLLDWIADVYRRAQKLGKTVLAFSHYPVIDPFDDRADAEREMFGDTNVVKRRPVPEVAAALIDAGMKAHFSGHLHINGTVHRQTNAGSLANIAVPSLVAFPPAFAIIRPSENVPDVDIIGLDHLAPDPDIMELYRREAACLDEAPHAAFDAKTYGEFLYEHTRALVVQRYFPNEWPVEMVRLFSHSTVADICHLMIATDSRYPALKELASADDLDIAALEACTMPDVVTDWYCLRQAQALALPYISPVRMEILRFLVRHFTITAVSDAAPAMSFLTTFFTVLGTLLERAGIRDAVSSRVRD